MNELFKALSHEHRTKILEYLLEEKEFTCICELEDIIDRDRSVVYRHFQKLKSAGILETRRKGVRVEARVKNPKKIKNLLKTAQEVLEHED